MEKLVKFGLSRQVLNAGKNLLQKRLNQSSKAISVGIISRPLHTTSISLTKYFTNDHEWIDVNAGVGIVGITDFAQEQLGDIVFVELPSIDSEYEKGADIATIESVKAASDLFSPVSGKVVEVNNELENNSALINESPFDEGWLVKIQLSNEEELKELMNEEQYNEYKKSL